LLLPLSSEARFSYAHALRKRALDLFLTRPTDTTALSHLNNTHRHRGDLLFINVSF
jgi:hypothetical protein